jgi:prepilin-type N-terminal cleavage/methylation domain-containing protein
MQSLSEISMQAPLPMQQRCLPIRIDTWLGEANLAKVQLLIPVELAMNRTPSHIRKSYSLRRTSEARLGPLLALSSLRSPDAQSGFTLVELLLVVVILGVLSIVGIPAYFAQTRKANINAANQAVLAAAKACAAAQVTGDTRSFTPGRGVVGACPNNLVNRDFTSDITRFTTLTTQAIARVAGSTGEVTLVASAN